MEWRRRVFAPEGRNPLPRTPCLLSSRERWSALLPAGDVSMAAPAAMWSQGRSAKPWISGQTQPLDILSP